MYTSKNPINNKIENKKVKNKQNKNKIVNLLRNQSKLILHVFVIDFYLIFFIMFD